LNVSDSSIDRPALPGEVDRFRTIFRRAHAAHPRCLADEWLMEPCALEDGSPAPRPIVWSRRNGPWRRSEILWVGAAPGNAGERGAGELGAHGTRIPFGGDISGANLEALFGSIGLTRNETFIVAALNQLPARGGGEPTVGELAAPVGSCASSLHLLRDTIVAVGARLVVALGGVAVRATIAAAGLEAPRPARGGEARVTLPTLARLQKAGIERGRATAWPEHVAADEAFLDDWRRAWGDAPLPHILWLTHPSAQNMSPFARVETAFHGRMVEARDALRRAAREVLGRTPPSHRPATPVTGIYALPEWRERIAPRYERLDRLWREKGI